MVDYLYRIAIQANSFHNNMADKMVWWITNIHCMCHLNWSFFIVDLCNKDTSLSNVK